MVKRKKIEPVRIWPPPREGEKYGPSPKQRLLFLDLLAEDEKPHKHGQDVVLFVGGSGSGKSQSSVARILQVCLKYPGTIAIVGGVNFPLLKRNVYPLYKDRLSVGTGEWNHPVVKRYPTEHRPSIEFKNGSKVIFLNLQKFEIIRGFNADIIHIEEANLLPSADCVDELVRRLRNRACPFKQLILTMNPSESRDWAYNKFQLKQLEREYIAKGGEPIPIAVPCSCQFCQSCKNEGLGVFEWEEGKCPNCNRQKVSTCPGRQQYYRVIQIRASENKHNPDTFIQGMEANTDEEANRLYVQGEIGDIRSSKAYVPFSQVNNVLSGEDQIPLDLTQDMVWTHDFNVAPMCSVIVQDTDHGPIAKDEIVEFDKDAEDICDEFEKRYPASEVKGTIWLDGDRSGTWGKGNTKQPTNFQLLYDTMKKKGYKVKLLVTRKKNPPIVDRVNCVNNLLKSRNGEVRLLINEKCIHLVLSLDGVKWSKNSGTPKEDDACDKEAKKARKKGMVMTHPAAALGYWIYRRYPLIMLKPPVRVLISPEQSFKHDGEQIVELQPPQPSVPEQTLKREGEVALWKQLGKVKLPNTLAEERRLKEEQEEAERELAFQKKLIAIRVQEMLR